MSSASVGTWGNREGRGETVWGLMGNCVGVNGLGECWAWGNWEFGIDEER